MYNSIQLNIFILFLLFFIIFTFFIILFFINGIGRAGNRTHLVALVVASALASAFACGAGTQPRRVESDLVPVGESLEIGLLGLVGRGTSGIDSSRLHSGDAGRMQVI